MPKAMPKCTFDGTPSSCDCYDCSLEREFGGEFDADCEWGVHREDCDNFEAVSRLLEHTTPDSVFGD